MRPDATVGYDAMALPYPGKPVIDISDSALEYALFC